MKHDFKDISDLPRQMGMDGAPIMAKAVRFATVAEPVAVAGNGRAFTFVFSDESVDRYGDVIQSRGWNLDNFNSNPVALFGHDAGSVENVIGNAKNVRVAGDKLVGDIEFMPADVNPNAEAVYQMVKGGWLKTVSVGFAPIEWKAAKDKARPGGVDFVKQELLEISIVPIPANPNALIQAKAAGVDLARLGLKAVDEPAHVARTAPPMTRKGLYSVSFLASILSDLGYLQDTVAWEAESEGDGSPVPDALMDAMKALGKVLIDMTAEEVAELVGGDDEDDLGAVIGMSAADARADIARSVLKMSPGALAGFAGVARDLAKGMTVQVKTSAPAPVVLRAGKAISAANEKKLREAHDHITKAAECVKGAFDPPDDADPEDGTGENDPTDTDNEAKAARARKAAAMKRRLSVV